MTKYPKWPRCPKCKSKKVTIQEVWGSHFIEWTPGTKQDEGILETGNPTAVYCECNNCKHRWRKRGCIQIKDEWWDSDATPTPRRMRNKD